MSTAVDTVPYTLQRQDASAAALDAAAEYAVSIAHAYVEWVTYSAPRRQPETPRTLAGADVLDLGPGPSLGAALLLACAGARVAVADKYLVSWDDDFHPAFVARLRARVAARGGAYQEPLRRVLAANAFDVQLDRVASDAESLAAVGRQWDFVFSNAVLEHVTDMAAAGRSLFHATRPGGIGFHQIDLRDHRDRHDPLRFLTIDAATFDALPGSADRRHGSRRRVPDYLGSFRDAGFRIVSATVNLRADDAYMARVQSQLAADVPTGPDADLSALGLFVCVERPAAS